MRRQRNRNWLRSISSGAAMADLALLLMVFFMTTTVTDPPRSFELEPPSGNVEPAEQQNIKISIDRYGVYYLNGERRELEEIYNFLVSRSYEKDTPVTITADKNLKYSIISALTGTLQDADFLNFTFIAEEKTPQNN
ncbi:MAG: biopolymer transporter ExbD [Leptospirales bacterium]